MDTLTLADRCYCGARGTRTVATSATTVMDTLTLADRCYCGARGTRVGATSAHSSDEPSDISGPCCYYHQQ
jgi:hypothetical protein